jgi:hypothetical protein
MSHASYRIFYSRRYSNQWINTYAASTYDEYAQYRLTSASSRTKIIDP